MRMRSGKERERTTVRRRRQDKKVEDRKLG